MKIYGEIDINKFEETFIKLIDRHETLRTSFSAVEDKVFSKVHKLEDINFKIEEIKAGREEEIDEKINEFIRPFNLEDAPLLRVGIITIEKDRHVMVIDMHHIISDGVSMSILTKDFSEIYCGKELDKLNIDYKDYAQWQLKKKESNELKKQEQYWLNEFSGDIPVLDIPSDYERPKVKDFKGNSIDFVLDKEITKNLRNIANDNECTMFMVLLADFNILLSKCSEQSDIIVGTPIAGRNHKDLENVVGMFVNTLAIRSNVDGRLDFKEYLKTVKDKTLNAFENQDYQFEELVEKLDMDRDVSRNPLFDVMFVFENMKEAQIEADGLNFEQYDINTNVGKFDMTMTAIEKNDEIHINLSYASSIYKYETIEKIVEYFKDIVELVSSNENAIIGDINVITKEEVNSYIENTMNNQLDEDEFEFDF